MFLVEIVPLVCDNARRTLSRYLHLEYMYLNGKNEIRKRFEDIGNTLELFNERLNQTIDELGEVFQSIKDYLKDPSSTEELVSVLMNRYEQRQRPFRIDFGDLK